MFLKTRTHRSPGKQLTKKHETRYTARNPFTVSVVPESVVWPGWLRNRLSVRLSRRPVRGTLFSVLGNRSAVNKRPKTGLRVLPKESAVNVCLRSIAGSAIDGGESTQRAKVHAQPVEQGRAGH